MGLLSWMFGGTDLYRISQNRFDKQFEEMLAKEIEADAKLARQIYELRTKTQRKLCGHTEIISDISIRCSASVMLNSSYCEKHDKYWRGE